MKVLLFIFAHRVLADIIERENGVRFVTGYSCGYKTEIKYLDYMPENPEPCTVIWPKNMEVEKIDNLPSTAINKYEPMGGHDYPCIEVNTNIHVTGYNERYDNVNSVELCIQLCFDGFQDSNAPCLAYTWIKSENRCFIKGLGSRESQAGMYSGAIENCIALPLPGSCLVKDLDYDGNDLQSHSNIESAEKCLILCKAYLDCYAFTWLESNHDCFLKKEGFENTNTKKANHISGSLKNCGLSLPRSCLHLGFVEGGNNLKYFDGVSSAEICMKLCMMYEACLSIAWMGPNEQVSLPYRCHLKRSAKPLEPRTNTVSGHREECMPTFETIGIDEVLPGKTIACLETNVNYAGGNYASPYKSTAINCLKACLEDNRCLQFVWVQYGGKCYLKNNPQVERAEWDSDHVSQIGGALSNCK